MNFTLLVASVGSGMGVQLASSRRLYSMGWDDVIPKRFFGALHARTQTPTNNVRLTGALAMVVAFIGVNLAALVHYSVRGGDRRLVSWLLAGRLWGACRKGGSVGGEGRNRTKLSPTTNGTP